MSTEVQEYKNIRVQYYKTIGVQVYKDTRVWESISVRVQQYNSTTLQQYKITIVQQYNITTGQQYSRTRFPLPLLVSIVQCGNQPLDKSLLHWNLLNVSSLNSWHHMQQNFTKIWFFSLSF